MKKIPKYMIIEGIVYDNIPVGGCSECTEGRWKCKQHGVYTGNERWTLYKEIEESGEEYFIR